MGFLISAIEPLLFVYIVNEMLDVKSKRVAKHALTFVWLYGAMLIKQYVNCKVNVIAIIIMFLPLILICIFPKMVYKAKGKDWIRIVISSYTCSLLSDGILFLIFQSKEPTEIAVFVAKLLGGLILGILLKVIGIARRNYLEYFIVCGYFLISIITLEAMYFVTRNHYKIFAFITQAAFLVAFVIFVIKTVNQYAHKEMMEISAQELRSLKHDVRNHYNLIYTMYKDNKTEELEAYFQKLNLDVQKNSLCSCTNVVLENAVNHTLQVCNREQIHFQYTLLTEEIPLSNVQQNVVLLNILNNAVEACRRCQGERYIRFSVRPTDYGETLIECCNSSPQVNEDLSTSKKNRKEHGIGIPTIKRIIKGKGKMMCSYSSGEFLVKILLGG